MNTRALSRLSLAQLAIAVVGLSYLFVGLAQIFAPLWFFESIGNFPPFNRHYLGDLGAFTAPIGIGLLLAARNPLKHSSLIGVVALGGLLHLGNHLYDDFLLGQWSLQHLLVQTLPLLVLALLPLMAWRRSTQWNQT